MTEGAEADDSRGWHERLGWAFGLTSDDPAVRDAALARLVAARRHVADALCRVNEMWRLTRPLGAEEQYRETAFAEARRRHRRAQGASLPEALWDCPPSGDLAAWPGLPYALLFLEWEATYPAEWTRCAKAWGTKQGLVRDLARADHEETVRAKLTDLVEMVVLRPYRCKDREYVRVARAVDGADLRGRLARAAGADSPWARCQAGYVLWLLDRPDLPNTPRVWRAWVAGGPAAFG
ncbi:hypothetical protein [Streptomyces sp. enrichment culture]|uniref:hypothetical protein n=1 Tax=Streptomyces sp. enrichment culture TaxID=1795815 RepID=UPI003F5797A4